jgi:nucleoside-diphosphate-sugar epimerase
MKILITGSSGFLGKHISNVFNSNDKVYSLARANAYFNIYLEKSTPKFEKIFDLVIHAAGKAHMIPKSESEKQEFFDVNVLGTNNLLQGLTNSSIPKYFIFISSVAVYGRDFGINLDENTSLSATDSYGLSKIEAERNILDWCQQHNVVCTILRLPLIVGSNPPGNLGSMLKGIQKGYYFNIAGGKAKKSMVLAEDVARFILKVAEIGGIYNLTDGYHPSFAELSNHISIQLGKGKPMNLPIWLAKIIANFGDLLGSKAPLNTNKLNKITSDLTFDDSKAREAFGWAPTPVLEGFKLNSNAQ